MKTYISKRMIRVGGMGQKEIYEPMRMTGRCASGLEADGGTRYHAVNGGGWDRAACGATPGSRGNGWSEYKGEEVTCPRCLKKVEAL